MLATIILDTFTKPEADAIAAALEMLCSPHHQGAFSSAAIYAFWSVPERELLYVGLAKDVARRFRQHLGLAPCDPLCCKVRQIEDYFSTRDRIGYSIFVQSTMCSPLSAEDERVVREAIDDDAGTVDVSDVFEAEENIAIAEGMLIELFEQRGDRLPKWNKIRGSLRGRRRRSFSSVGFMLRAVQGLEAGKTFEQIEEEIAAQDYPYELLLNLEGSELSELNARATLREIADNDTVWSHELILHGIRISIISGHSSFEQSVKTELAFNEFAKGQIDLMKADGYWDRKVTLPGLGGSN